MRETQRTSSSHQIPTLTLKSTAMSRVSEHPSGAPIRAGCTLARPLQLAACNLLCSYGLPGIETCRTSSSSEPRFSARGCKFCDNARRLCSFNALAYRAPQPRRCSTGRSHGVKVQHRDVPDGRACAFAPGARHALGEAANPGRSAVLVRVNSNKTASLSPAS
jgi:hypothetical protein